jgi:3-phosphoinositide dependent protein kinase-1
MDQVTSSPKHYSTMSNASSTHAAGGREPTLDTEVDNPSHPLYHHRRVVNDFDYGDILGEGSYSTVRPHYMV